MVERVVAEPIEGGRGDAPPLAPLPRGYKIPKDAQALVVICAGGKPQQVFMRGFDPFHPEVAIACILGASSHLAHEYIAALAAATGLVANADADESSR